MALCGHVSDRHKLRPTYDVRGLSISKREPQALPEHAFFIYPEDDAATITLIRAALRKLNAEDRLIHCPEGDAAMQCVRDCLISRNFPSFVMLNAHSGNANGFEILKWIRSLPEIRSLPVIIISSAPTEEEVDLSLVLGATNYYVKPAAYQGFCTLLNELLHRFSPPIKNDLPRIAEFESGAPGDSFER